MTEQRPKACVILGAGASHDVWNPGSPPADEAYRPPLAIDLFNIGAHPSFATTLGRYSGADDLAHLLAERPDIEESLRRLAFHSDAVTRRQFKEIPPYLRDLIHLTTDTFAHKPGCYLELTQALLADHPHDVLFLVLNYDTLLERFLYRRNLRFETIDDYVDPDRQAKIVKLHGSTDWFVTMGDINEDWFELVNDFDIFQKPPPEQIVIGEGIGDVSTAEVDGNRLYPLLTAPLAGKDSSAVVCPTEHRKVAEEFLADCGKLLIIGTSGQDDDLLDLLNDSLGADINRIIHVVGKDGAKGTLQRFRRRVPTLKVSIEPLMATGGFQAYVRSEEFQRFLQ